jgi:hypothetical protein
MYKIDEQLLSFSKQQYYELLKLEKLNQLNEEIEDVLRRYDEIACAQINWEMKEQYFSVLNDYCTGKFDEPDLSIKLSDISESASKLHKIIRQYNFVISPHLKCLKLDCKIDELICKCDEYTEELNEAEWKQERKDLTADFQTVKDEIHRDSKVILTLIVEN